MTKFRNRFAVRLAYPVKCRLGRPSFGGFYRDAFRLTVIATAMVKITKIQNSPAGIDPLTVLIKQPPPPLPAAEATAAGLMPKDWTLSSPKLSTDATP